MKILKIILHEHNKYSRYKKIYFEYEGHNLCIKKYKDHF